MKYRRLQSGMVIVLIKMIYCLNKNHHHIYFFKYVCMFIIYILETISYSFNIIKKARKIYKNPLYGSSFGHIHIIYQCDACMPSLKM